MKITVEKKASDKRKKELGVSKWPEWSHEPDTFDWSYDSTETCYIIEGEATVKTDEEEISFGPGDIVTFPKGLKCTWSIRKKIKKKYKFT